MKIKIKKNLLKNVLKEIKNIIKFVKDVILH